jgi:hypothetical protein
MATEALAELTLDLILLFSRDCGTDPRGAHDEENVLLADCPGNPTLPFWSLESGGSCKVCGELLSPVIMEPGTQ